MSFRFGLEQSQGEVFEGGTKRTATARDIQGLRGLSIYSLTISPGCLRELHWHPNAGELSYCLEGQGRMGIFSPAGDHDIFDFRAGHITFIPRNYLHFIENTGAVPLRMIVAFSHENPEHIDVSESFDYFPSSVMAKPFGIPDELFERLPKRGDTFLVKNMTQGRLEGTYDHPASPYAVHADELSFKEFEGGKVRLTKKENLARLEDCTVFLLTAQGRGLREPHWHPNAGELNYCVSGNASVGIFGPGGVRETVNVGPGDVVFIPAGWFHYIDNVGDTPIEFLVFFSNVTPNHIDLTQTFDYFPRGIYASSFGKEASAFDPLPKRGDVFIAAGR